VLRRRRGDAHSAEVQVLADAQLDDVVDPALRPNRGTGRGDQARGLDTLERPCIEMVGMRVRDQHGVNGVDLSGVGTDAP
jgi:hypothetical protein